MKEEKLKQILKKHKSWRENKPCGKKANLKAANKADVPLLKVTAYFALVKSTIAFPLWCGSFDMKVSQDLFNQLCYHLCQLEVDVRKRIQKQLAKYGNQWTGVQKYNLKELEG